MLKLNPDALIKTKNKITKGLALSFLFYTTCTINYSLKNPSYNAKYFAIAMLVKQEARKTARVLLKSSSQMP